MKIIVTGNAGFIGNQLTLRLLQEGHSVIGIDNFNSDIYDAKFKHTIPNSENFKQFQGDILDYNEFGDSSIDAIIHLATAADGA